MAYYWVNLGDSFEEVRNGHFLWAPSHTYTKSGTKTVSAGWKHVPDVKKGDVIICHEDKHIIYLARAISNAYPSPRPESRAFDKWKKEGYKIDVELTVLDVPLNNAEFKHDILGRFNEQCSPKLFGSNEQATQSYLISLPKHVAAIVLNCIGDELNYFLESLLHTGISLTTSQVREKDTRVKARVGQGQFRKEVLAIWNNTCPVTRVNNPRLLIASHIHSWYSSDNIEKVDGYNGLPLAPNVDKLFDKGLISFADDGSLLKSSDLSVETLNALGISEDTKISGLKPQHCVYLRKHRKAFGFNHDH
jgi:hypothetical protein